MSDLQAKYQKLAAEYSKIRAQLPVLKKAVLDEQATNEEFKETIKSKDQSIRKYEQEVDSLAFRNQQLELRVSILQKELDQSQPNHGKKPKEKKNSATPSLMPSIEVIDEELRLKIEENARLHRKVADLDQEHQSELNLLEKRIQEAESELERNQSKLKDYKSRHLEDIDMLTKEKSRLEEKIEKQRCENLKSAEKVKIFERELKSVTESLTSQLDRANSIINQKLSFNDTADESLNSLNVRSPKVQTHARSHDLMSTANQVTDGLLSSFENLFGHMEVKVGSLASNSDFKGAADELKRFLQRLSESDPIVQPIRTSLLQLQISDNQDSFQPSVMQGEIFGLYEAVDNFVSYTKQIISCELQCLEIESNQSYCTEMLSAKISDLQRSFVQFASAITEVQQRLSAMLNNSQSNDSQDSLFRGKQLMLLSQTVMSWMEVCKDLSRSHKSKSTLEHQLPTCAMNIKMADERINTSLSDLVNSVSKLSSFLSSNIRSIIDLLSFVFSSDHPCLSSLRNKAVKYKELITRATPESVPSSIAIQNRKLIECFAQNKNDLSQQVLHLQERLNKVEQEKEHWSLEAQLMSMKYKKEIEKFNALAKNSELSGHQSESVDNHLSSGMVLTSELGRLEIVDESGEVNDSDWVATREKIVSGHYERRINDLISNLQLADAKALYFHSECRALHKQMVTTMKERDRLQSEIGSTNQSMADLRDELQTTSRSYEGQLSLMSEHLAGMNEKLTDQKDEIDALKYQLLQQHHHQPQQTGRNILRRGK